MRYIVVNPLKAYGINEDFLLYISNRSKVGFEIAGNPGIQGLPERNIAEVRMSLKILDVTYAIRGPNYGYIQNVRPVRASSCKPLCPGGNPVCEFPCAVEVYRNTTA